MTTPVCIAALRRFESRRRCPTQISTDNGSNFLDAKSVAIQKVLEMIYADSLRAEAAGINIIWKVIPPRAPHSVGLWETLFCQIELILSSRSICQLSERPNDAETLTPAHFRLDDKFETLPLIEGNDNNTTSFKKWSQLQNSIINFCKRRLKEYVTSLQERTKSKRETSNLKVRDVVYVFDDNGSPLQWAIDKVVYVYSGTDQFVRVVRLKTAIGIHNRPVHKLRNLFDVKDAA